MSKRFCATVLALLVLCTACNVYAKTNSTSILDEQIDAFDFSTIESALDALVLGHMFPEGFAQTIRQIVTSQTDFSQELLQTLGDAVQSELVAVRGMFALLCSIWLVCALCDECMQGLQVDGIQVSVRFVCGALCAVVLTKNLIHAVGFASDMLEKLCFWMENLLPVMLVILSTLGASASVNALSPSFAAVNGILQQGIAHIVFPMILAMGAFAVVDALDEKRRLHAVITFLAQLIRWSLGLILTLFVGMLTIKSINAVSYDALSIRTMKFTLGSLPMVGGAVSDSMDTIISSLLMLKNGVGTAGMIISALICIAPIVRIALQLLCMQGCSALMQSLGGGTMQKMISSMCSVYRTLLYVLIAALLLFFVTTTLFIGAGNAVFTG